MLILALALHAFTITDITPPPVVRTVSNKKLAKRRPARIVAKVTPRNYRLTLLDQASIARAPDTGQRYRVSSYAVVEDHKMRALSGPVTPCGLTGAPKCPSRGRKVLTAAITND